jgi:hypothetical protein
MWVAYSMRDSVISEVFFFLVRRTLRGGEGHCRHSRSFCRVSVYLGRIRGGREDMSLIVRRALLEEKHRRQGSTRRGTKYLMVEVLASLK